PLHTRHSLLPALTRRPSRSTLFPYTTLFRSDRIAKVHRSPLAIGQPPIVQHLQQYVEHVRVGFLDFVEQDHAIRLAAHCFGQVRSEEHTSELQSRENLVCRLLLEKKKDDIQY